MSQKNIRLLDLVKTFENIIPSVAPPKRPIKLQEKIMLTAIVLFIYLLCSQIPIYGTNR